MKYIYVPCNTCYQEYVVSVMQYLSPLISALSFTSRKYLSPQVLHYLYTPPDTHLAICTCKLPSTDNVNKCPSLAKGSLIPRMSV